jgi:hypothetical protein
MAPISVSGWSGTVWRWIGRSIQRADTTRLGATLNMSVEGSGKAATSSHGYIGSAFERAGPRPIVRTVRTPALRTLECAICVRSTNQAAIIALFRVMNRYVGKPPDRCWEGKADMSEHAAISSRPQVHLNGLLAIDFSVA